MESLKRIRFDSEFGSSTPIDSSIFCSIGFGGFRAKPLTIGVLLANQAKPAFTNTATGGAGLFTGASKPGRLFGNTVSELYL